MVSRPFIGLAGVALLCAGSAGAQTQVQMNATAAGELRRADAALNAQWQRTYASMKGHDAHNDTTPRFGYAAATLDSQRAWLRFRDAQCVIESGEFAGGSIQPLTRVSCLVRLTRARTAQLKELMWKR